MRECLARQQAASPRGLLARVIGRSPLHSEAHSWYFGALGEVAVANVLAQLGPRWTVLHSVQIGSSSSVIDHLIIGPGGIFAINITNHSGKKIWIGGSTFLVNGYKHEYLRIFAHEAARASRLLSVVTARPITVTPLIVVVNPASIMIGRKRPKVVVISSANFNRWLAKRSQVLSDRAVAHYSMFAEERSTWQSEPGESHDNADQLQRFERLRVQVDAARKRARLCLIVAAVALVLLSPLAIAQLFGLLGGLLAMPGN